MDETGHSDDPNFHFSGMAGFVAPADQWKIFEPRWQAILDRFGLKEPFHMKDFAHFQGQFKKGWKDNEAKRRDLFGQLLREILGLKPIPVGAIVSVEAFNGLTKCQQDSFKNPYHVTFQICTKGAAVLAAFLDNEKVAMVYSYNQEFGAIPSKDTYSVDQAGDAEKLWHTMQQITDHGKWMGSYASSTPAEMVPLQAADVFAYELAKEFENILVHPKLEMRWGLQQILTLVPLPTALIRILDRKELLRLVKEANFPCRTGIEEVDDNQMWDDRLRLLQHWEKRTKTTAMSSEEYKNFDRMMRNLMSVSHEAIKTALDAEKMGKEKKKKQKVNKPSASDHASGDGD